MCNLMQTYHTVDHEIVDVKFILIKFWLNSFAQQVAPGYSASVHQSSDAHTSDGQSHRNGRTSAIVAKIIQKSRSNTRAWLYLLSCRNERATLPSEASFFAWVVQAY